MLYKLFVSKYFMKNIYNVNIITKLEVKNFYREIFFIS